MHPFINNAQLISFYIRITFGLKKGGNFLSLIVISAVSSIQTVILKNFLHVHNSYTVQFDSPLLTLISCQASDFVIKLISASTLVVGAVTINLVLSSSSFISPPYIM